VGNVVGDVVGLEVGDVVGLRVGDVVGDVLGLVVGDCAAIGTTAPTMKKHTTRKWTPRRQLALREPVMVSACPCCVCLRDGIGETLSVQLSAATTVENDAWVMVTRTRRHHSCRSIIIHAGQYCAGGADSGLLIAVLVSELSTLQ
jgi:hypothetical protein